MALAQLPREDQSRYPAWVRFALRVLGIWLHIYDFCMYPFYKMFSDPEARLRRSRRVKALPLKEGDPSSPWRYVDNMEGLQTKLFQDYETLDAIWDRASMFYGDLPCFGTRQVLAIEQEKQPNGKVFEKVELGDYEWQTYREIDERVSYVGSGLSALGQQANDKVVILAETRCDWMITALACFKYSFPVVTVYATLGEDAIAHAIKQTQATTIVTTQELVPTVMKTIPHCEELKLLVYFESQVPDTQPPVINQSRMPKGFKVKSLAQLEEIGETEDIEPLREPTPDDIAMIMYTSGTTGLPKGVIISHRNLVAATAGLSSRVPGLGPGDTYIAYLPLAHVLELSAEFSCISRGAALGYSSPLTMHDQASKIKRGAKGDATVLRPTVMASVPTIMDRIFKAVVEKVRKSSQMRQALFYLLYERKRARLEEGYDNPFLNRLVFSHIRAILGGKLRLMLSGGAPLNAETERFMNICFCCPVGQGYGLTETCGAGTISNADDLSTGRVGPPVSCCDIMLRNWEEGGYKSDDQPCARGEVLISGDNVVQGYLNDKEKTDEVFVSIEGRKWFCTGDIAQIDPDGSLRIIDRKKDLLKLSHGEYVSLGKVETSLLTCPLLDNICIYGNSHESVVIALVVPNRKGLEELAKKLGKNTDDFNKLCDDKDVVSEVTKLLNEHGKKNKLQKMELPAKVHICKNVWSADEGLLTEAMKLKRKPIENYYKDAINALYQSL